MVNDTDSWAWCGQEFTMYHHVFTHSPTERHLGCFQLQASTNKAAINIHVQSSWKNLNLSFGRFVPDFFIIFPIILNHKVINHKSEILLKAFGVLSLFFSIHLWAILCQNWHWGLLWKSLKYNWSLLLVWVTWNFFAFSPQWSGFKFN